jgi:hypothetical protein
MALEILAAIVALLAAILPPIIAAWVRNNAKERIQQDALTRHSIDELHHGTDRVRQPPPPAL